MAIPRLFNLLLIISLFISATIATSSAPSLYPSIATATHTSPLTLFAPSDAYLPILLQELSLPGLYPFHSLKTLPSPTILQTLIPTRCLTITTTHRVDVFINGVEITRPDLFKNDFLIIHGLQGNISHLSPLSCNIKDDPMMTPPSNIPRRRYLSSLPPSPPSPHAAMHVMLNDAINRLQTTGYYVVSLALHVNYVELLSLEAATIFAIDDTNSILLDQGKPYLSGFRYHVVPNIRLTSTDIANLPWNTSLRTMDDANRLTVTVSGGGRGEGLSSSSSSSSTVEINHVKITSMDLVHNTRIAVHGISTLFPRVRQDDHDHQEKEVLNLAALKGSKIVHSYHGTDKNPIWSNRIGFLSSMYSLLVYAIMEAERPLRCGLMVVMWFEMFVFAEANDLFVVVVTGDATKDPYGLVHFVGFAACFWCVFKGLGFAIKGIADWLDTYLTQFIDIE